MQNETYSGAQIVVKLLERQGIDVVAGIPGGANLPIYDALNHSPIRHILARHEQGAGFIAQGIARSTGEPAVCLASSGPGATNLITAIADAKMDSIPVIAITGQVPTSMIGTDAFQEVDTFGLMLPITKHNWVVRSAAELLEVIPEAFRIALSGRPGPVAIDIPKDVQVEQIEITRWPAPGRRDTNLPAPLDTQALHAALQLLNKAKRPMMMIGGGIIHAGCSWTVASLAEKLDIPVVASFMGLGAMPTQHPLFLGMLGMHGARYTNLALDECDVLLAAGVRFDDRATGNPSHFCSKAHIIHIDIDASELDKIKIPAIGINADIGAATAYLLEHAQPQQRPAWRQEIAELRTRYPLEAVEGEQNNLFTPYALLQTLAQLAPQDSLVVTDVGQHQMWTAQVYPFSHPRQWLSSGGLGTMGFGLPTAIGAALAQSERTVLCISGDGSMLMNMQELDTLAEHHLNVKVIVLNNQHLGLVKQQQTLFYGARHLALRNRQSVDFSAMARAFGIGGYDLGRSNDPLVTLTQALQVPGPLLINVPIDPEAMVLPMVPPGAGNREMIIQQPKQRASQ